MDDAAVEQDREPDIQLPVDSRLAHPGSRNDPTGAFAAAAGAFRGDPALYVCFVTSDGKEDREQRGLLDGKVFGAGVTVGAQEEVRRGGRVRRGGE